FHDKGFSLTYNVEDNGCQKNKTFYYLLHILVNAHDTHTKVQNAHQKSTDDNAGYRTGSAVCGCAADEAGADSVHLEVRSCRGVGGIQTGGSYHTRDRCQESHVQVCKEVYSVGVDTGELRRLLIAAYSVEITSHCSLGRNVCIDCDHYRDPYKGVGDTFVLSQTEHKRKDCGTDQNHLYQGAC